jgi:hypothetical protein
MLNSKVLAAEVIDDQAYRLKGKNPFYHYPKNLPFEELPEIHQTIIASLSAN